VEIRLVISSSPAARVAGIRAASFDSDAGRRKEESATDERIQPGDF
jgi:hypothetical protein